MSHKPRPSDQSRIPTFGKKRPASLTKNEPDDGKRFSILQPKQSLASTSRQQGSLCFSASNPRMRGPKEYWKEMRPLNDKTYVDKMKENIIRFLKEHGLPEFTKCINSPNNSDFKAMIEHFIVFLGMPENFRLSPKLEESVISLMAIIDYPITLQKRNVQIFGSAHAWASMLGVLDFLRVLAEQDLHVCEDLVENLPKDEREIFKHELKCYKLFLGGRDDFDKELEELKIHALGNRNIKREIEQHESQQLEQEQMISKLIDDIVTCKKELEEKEKYEINLLQFKNQLLASLDSLASDYNTTEQDHALLKIQQQSIDDEIATLTSEVEQREREVTRQGQLSFDVHKLESEFISAKKDNFDLEKENNNFKMMIEEQHQVSNKMSEEIKQILVEYQQSPEMKPYLLRDEEELIFRMMLKMDRQPEHAASLENLVRKAKQQETNNKMKLDENLEELNTRRKKEMTISEEDKLKHLTNIIDKLNRENVNVIELHQSEQKDINEEIHKQELLNKQNIEELLALDNQTKLVAKEVRVEELKFEEMRRKCLDKVKEMTRMDKRRRENVERIIKRNEEVMIEDRIRMREIFNNLKTMKK